ncbi:MAG TPA: nicotinate-nucleotide--dimethylbenzimidazole phosphoribosyltransferase [Syntrophomonadaceae bacterium]|nr:nicotinate-nucleotide--dimethylbenzimidazole phosphoribosyltransferase [Syntrophomonadaceae bacterium]
MGIDQVNSPGLGRLNGLHDKLSVQGCPAQSWTLVVFAGDNGISREHTSHYPPLQSGDLVLAHLDGSNPTVRLLERLNRREWLIDVGLYMDLNQPRLIDKRVSKGTRNFLCEDALDHSQVLSAMNAGQSAWDLINYHDFDIIGLGEIGIADTLCAAALGVAVLELPEAALVGQGSANRSVIDKKSEIIKRALEYRHPDPANVIDLLARFGGLEIAALTGFIVKANEKGIPIMLDGYVTSVAALLASQLNSDVIPYLIAPSLSAETGHAIILNRLGLEPLFDLSLNYGEGLASVIGLFLAEITMSFFH